MLVAKASDKVLGFVIGKITSAPEVYHPGGLTLMIDDFCVKAHQWMSVGKPLITELQWQAKNKHVSQILVVCGAHDVLKRSFLKRLGLTVASQWFVGMVL